MTCYNCARTPCDSQCPTGGVYAKAITKASNVNVWTIPTSDKQTWTLAAPERKSVILSVEEFTKLQAKAARVDALEAELKAMRAMPLKLVYKGDAGAIKIVDALPAPEDRKPLRFDATGCAACGGEVDPKTSWMLLGARYCSGECWRVDCAK